MITIGAYGQASYVVLYDLILLRYDYDMLVGMHTYHCQYIHFM